MKYVVFSVLALLMLAAGVLWTGEAYGWFGGEAATDGPKAVLGPALAGLGLAMGIVVAQNAVHRD
ncbi:hypothetical protein [Nocardioides sp. GY 10127]|uniref:hypothetical protein n=1 Tax=Nocardioides sp. GY 10127 TaxID=2569762 RepID=UPI0010A86DFD|nr:hypothetical protein [Nocardioides sp. GY 10127]TIC80196.1 hypothetical protein E8D37_16565 [Nocardioides sp. GY 10127]